jgi:ribosomal protein L33
MKTITILAATLAGIFALSQIFTSNTTENTPQVLINGGTGKLDLEKYCPKAPSAEEPTDSSIYTYTDNDGKLHTTKHCITCRAGVYVVSEKGEGKYCSFCGEKE